MIIVRTENLSKLEQIYVTVSQRIFTFWRALLNYLWFEMFMSIRVYSLLIDDLNRYCLMWCVCQ